MFATDFEYDGIRLSTYGFVICSFDGSSSVETVSTGAKISFNTVSKFSGTKYSLAGSKYEECIQATFSICKNPCVTENLAISDSDMRALLRWLNRREFHQFRLIPEDNRSDCYYNASFNIEKIVSEDVVCGLTLTMETDSPFGFGAETTQTINVANSSTSYQINDNSDEIGERFATLIITCTNSGNIQVTNETLSRVTLIKNCTAGEVITLDGETLIISSSDAGHKLYRDFNFEFFKIGNTLSSKVNTIKASAPCTLTVKYKPVIKGGVW